MKNDSMRASVITSLIWKLLESGGTQGIQFIIQIVLARLLLPEEFGLIVLVIVFITLANVLVQSGFSVALIQKKDANEVDFSSVFYLNLMTASLIFNVLFLMAPFIGQFFEQPQLPTVLRVLSITLFFGVFTSIQNAVIARNMQFKKLFASSMGGVIVSGAVGITMAYAGLGVWALVGQQLVNQFVVMMILLITVQWKPKLVFSITRIKILFSFGWKLLVASMLDTLYINLSNLFIGKIFSSSMLGYYNRGDQFPKFIVGNINGSIQSVIFPALSAHQDDPRKVKELVRRAIVTSAFLIFPMMVGLAIIAEPLISLLLTAKWLPAVPFLQIFAASYALWPIHTANLQAINALGRSDVFLKLEVIKKILGTIILTISIPFGVHAMAMGVLVGSIISGFINAFPNKKLLNYSIKEQIFDILPSLLISLAMGLIIYQTKWLVLPDLLNIALQITLGIIIYAGLARLFKLECYTYLLSIGIGLLRKKGI